MTRTRFNRRSFLGQVAGGGVAVGALATVGAARAQAPRQRMAIDADPTDPARARPSPYDADAGATADSPATIRAPGSGVTDSDTGPNADPANRGRGGRGYRVVTDSDAGPNADASGHGRGSGPSAAPDPAPAPSPGQSAVSGPLDSFVICPGHPRCPT